MKYHPWDKKLSRYHFLPRYISAVLVQAVNVRLSADMIKHVFLILMSQKCQRTQ